MATRKKKPTSRPAKKKAKPAAKRTPPTTPAPPPTPPGKDKYGCRLGSKCSKICLAVTDKPRTVGEVRTAAGLEEKDHPYVLGNLRWMVEQGYAKQTEDKKYVLA